MIYKVAQESPYMVTCSVDNPCLDWQVEYPAEEEEDDDDDDDDAQCRSWELILKDSLYDTTQTSNIIYKQI